VNRITSQPRAYPSPGRIADRRWALGLTLREASERVRDAGSRCSESTFWNWESGRSRVQVRAWAALAEALETTPAALGGRLPPTHRVRR
jgi:hypothetical protein